MRHALDWIRDRDRDRRSRAALGGQLQPLLHAEAMLLIDDRKTEMAEAYLLLEKCVGADAQLRTAVGNRLQRAAAGACRLRTGQQAHRDP